MIQTGILNGIDAIIFDMDGTILDSMWIWVNIDDDYLEKYRLIIPADFHETMEGKSFTETAQYFIDSFPQITCSVEELMDEWTDMALQKYVEEVKLKTGVLEFIEKMHAEGKKLGVATSCARKLVDGALSACNLSPYFDSVRTSCEVKQGKPAPDVYLRVAEDMDVSPERCLVFEDVPMGIMAGKNAGMKVCGVDDAFSRPQEKKKKELADYYIQTFLDISNNTYEVLT